MAGDGGHQHWHAASGIRLAPKNKWYPRFLRGVQKGANRPAHKDEQQSPNPEQVTATENCCCGAHRGILRAPLWLLHSKAPPGPCDEPATVFLLFPECRNPTYPAKTLCFRPIERTYERKKAMPDPPSNTGILHGSIPGTHRANRGPPAAQNIPHAGGWLQSHKAFALREFLMH